MVLSYFQLDTYHITNFRYVIVDMPSNALHDVAITNFKYKDVRFANMNGTEKNQYRWRVSAVAVEEGLTD